jgi:hypothetical protein
MEPRIEAFARGEDGLWRLREAASLTASLEIPALTITLALAEVYANVAFTATSIRGRTVKA